MLYDLSHQGSPALPLDVTIAFFFFFLVYKLACDKKIFWNRIAICWWKQTNISLPVTKTARDSYLPDKGCEYFRAGYKLTVGKWIPPHMCSFLLPVVSAPRIPWKKVRGFLLWQSEPWVPIPTMGGTDPSAEADVTRSGKVMERCLRASPVSLSPPGSPQSGFTPFPTLSLSREASWLQNVQYV